MKKKSRSQIIRKSNRKQFETHTRGALVTGHLVYPVHLHLRCLQSSSSNASGSSTNGLRRRRCFLDSRGKGGRIQRWRPTMSTKARSILLQSFLCHSSGRPSTRTVAQVPSIEREKKTVGLRIVTLGCLMEGRTGAGL